MSYKNETFVKSKLRSSVYGIETNRENICTILMRFESQYHSIHNS